MKKIIVVIFFQLLSCSSKNYIIQNEIRGTVLNMNNKPISDVEVTFYNDGKDFGFVPFALKTNENGVFIVERIKVKGDYRISRMLSDKLPSKIIFKKRGFISDTVSISDYSDFKSDKILINQYLMQSKK
ncbi:hypothetical protein ACFSX9_01350 [Flavobacterium ardleyense]|uniref:Carboxypeptidase regulatory-like domain-containing protein n=1 Tax=Flavobacterium ardleyense TaxID=2038737 RepID=A0ABW5Z3N3_9FLAO